MTSPPPPAAFPCVKDMAHGRGMAPGHRARVGPASRYSAVPSASRPGRLCRRPLFFDAGARRAVTACLRATPAEGRGEDGGGEDAAVSWARVLLTDEDAPLKTLDLDDLSARAAERASSRWAEAAAGAIAETDLAEYDNQYKARGRVPGRRAPAFVGACG